MTEAFTTERDYAGFTLEIQVVWNPEGRDLDEISIQPVFQDNRPPKWLEDGMLDACIGEKARDWALALAQQDYDRRREDEDDRRYHEAAEGAHDG